MMPEVNCFYPAICFQMDYSIRGTRVIGLGEINGGHDLCPPFDGLFDCHKHHVPFFLFLFLFGIEILHTALSCFQSFMEHKIMIRKPLSFLICSCLGLVWLETWSSLDYEIRGRQVQLCSHTSLHVLPDYVVYFRPCKLLQGM